jgi:mono/diheme cytochrome c family protein
MISARMSRAAKAFPVLSASLAVALVATACGSQKISVSKSSGPAYQGAVLFNQRCSGCHTLSYAAAHGSAANVRTAEFNNGPNFNVRCERPVSRVLYAIENGGFSGAIMPQNVVVGQQAIDVADFVAKYAGRQAPKVPGATICSAEPIGSIPAPVATIASAAGATSGGATGAAGATGPSGATGAKGSTAAKAHHAAGKRKP